MFIKDSIFKEFLESKKWKELFNIRSLEFHISIIVTIITSILLYNVLSYSNIDDINTILRTLTKDIAISLMGLMGFLITGLAILISGISSRVMNLLTKRNKDKSMNKIFLGFYFEGFLIGVLITILLVTYIISFLDRPLNIWFCMSIIILVTYLVVFVMFYSVSLIGNCISVFRIVNNYNIDEINFSSIDMLTEEDKILYKQVKTLVLKNLLLLDKNELGELDIIKIYNEVLKSSLSSLCNDENQKNRILNYIYTNDNLD